MQEYPADDPPPLATEEPSQVDESADSWPIEMPPEPPPRPPETELDRIRRENCSRKYLEDLVVREGRPYPDGKFLGVPIDQRMSKDVLLYVIRTIAREAKWLRST